ncbi:hypothetical protein O6H91_18G003400 [Diphasiastrum complanatum]|uniref:Uncharacterized protein n=1 Tax=Diphasiastrum complanatum TaxID=34168 RepID=A0ACC2AXL1_DIPCM|nr:hypothetical protein O6H91_18G003400 [Diphasiastrum complanatum]
MSSNCGKVNTLPHLKFSDKCSNKASISSCVCPTMRKFTIISSKIPLATSKDKKLNNQRFLLSFLDLGFGAKICMLLIVFCESNDVNKFSLVSRCRFWRSPMHFPLNSSRSRKPFAMEPIVQLESPFQSPSQK